MKATPQRKARRTGLTGRGRVRRNLWPFDSFKTSTTYHVKTKRGPTTSGAGTFKGHRIERRPDGGFVVPSIDRDTVLDDKRQAKRFIAAQTKYNAGRKKNGRPVMTYQLAHAAATDAANKSMRKAGRTSWSKADYNVAARTFKKLFKGNPGENAFARCVTELSKRPGVASPRGVCAAAGRKKYGKKKFAKMGRAGKARAARTNAGSRRRKNTGADPLAAAVKSYKGFHGRPPSKILKVSERVHVPDSHLPGLGDLQSICIRHVGGRKKTDLDFGRGVVLCRNVKKTQLFIRGGDQSAPLAVFGIEKPYHDQEVLGEALSVDYFTTKDHLAPEDGGTATYRHKFGRKKPTIVYSVPDKKLSFAGGGYTIPDEGIDL